MVEPASMTPERAQRITDQVAAVRADIAHAANKAGRNPSAVRLIAVTKSQGPEVLPILAACGIADFGENRCDHLAQMAAHAASGVHFHHLGRIQSRQCADIVGHASTVHGLVEVDHARKLDRAATAAGKRLSVFLQVNVSGEGSKAGVEPEALEPLLAAVQECPSLECAGLMTMAPILGEHADEAEVRACFAALRRLAETWNLPRLSMGMSGDLALAVAEGATDVRVGTRLFV